MSGMPQTHAPERSEAPLRPPFSGNDRVRPVICADGSHRLAGGWACFDCIDLVQRSEDSRYFVSRMGVDNLIELADDRNLASAAIDGITSPRPDFAGLEMSSPRIMGILNVTPDSFFDGGVNNAPLKAVAAGRAMIQAGSDIIDIGGESTRPGADEVSCNQELARVLPPLARLSDSGVLLSIDTRRAEVMTRATGQGARIINDVEALCGEGSIQAAAKSGASVILMHMKGKPKTMQESPVYGFAPSEIYDFLEKRVAAAMKAGIPRERLAVDPGYGFGKSLEHNLAIMNWAAMFHGIGVPVMIGASRKRSIAAMSNGEEAGDRLAGSLALALKAIEQGCQLVRVHDVAHTRQALAVHAALGRDAGAPA